MRDASIFCLTAQRSAFRLFLRMLGLHSSDICSQPCGGVQWVIQFLLIPKYTIELTYVIKPVLYGRDGLVRSYSTSRGTSMWQSWKNDSRP